MTNTFRALCVELVELSAPADSIPQLTERLQKLAELANRARAALAQSEPVAPTDEALANFSGWFCRNYPGPDTIIHKPEWHAPKVFRAAADAIARYARPAIQPVPVASEVRASVVELQVGVEFLDNEGLVVIANYLRRAIALLERLSTSTNQEESK
jgi:hypothetical protein